MKVPRVIVDEVERVGRLILTGNLSYDDGIDALEPLLDKEEHRLFLQDIKRRFLRNQIKGWIAQHLGTATEEQEYGQQALPFPDLPPHIEIAPGLFKHQNAMNNIRDWDAALLQAETKAANAVGYVERIRQARDRWIHSTLVSEPQ